MAKDALQFPKMLFDLTLGAGHASIACMQGLRGTRLALFVPCLFSGSLCGSSTRRHETTQD